jgi:hypothetical protein
VRDGILDFGWAAAGDLESNLSTVDALEQFFRPPDLARRKRGVEENT